VNEIRFVVTGTPKGQPRVKAYSRGGKAGVYDPGTADDWKYAVRQAAIENAPEQKFSGPVGMSMGFLFQRPKRLLKKSSPDGLLLRDSKPDLDNLVKAVKDAITDSGAVWHDDSQVASESAVKQYLRKDDSVPRAIVTIWEYDS
jgi:Holliday junction resolvase RusA-like endonuclease